MQKAKLTIGCDIDDTLTPWTASFLNYYNKKYNTHCNFDHMTKFGLNEFLKIPKDEARGKMYAFAKSELSHLIPYEDAVKGIDFLHKEGHDIYAITSRGEIFQEVTEKWISKNFPHKFSGVYLTNEASPTGFKISKADVMDKFNIDVHIEDNIEIGKKVAEKGYNVIILEQPWNKYKKIDPEFHSSERIYRVGDWFGVISKITELSCEKFKDMTHK